MPTQANHWKIKICQKFKKLYDNFQFAQSSMWCRTFFRWPWVPSSLAPTRPPCGSGSGFFENVIPALSSHTCFLSIALLSTLNSHSGYHLPFFPSPEARYVIQLYFQYFTIKSWKWFFHNCSADQYHKCVNSYLWRHMTSIIWSSTSVMESWEFSTTCTARTSSSGNIHIWVPPHF